MGQLALGMQARHSPPLWQPWRALECWSLGMGPCLQMQHFYPQVPSSCQLMHTPDLLQPELQAQTASTAHGHKGGPLRQWRGGKSRLTHPGHLICLYTISLLLGEAWGSLT